MDSSRNSNPWTLCGLVKAFVDLALAYLLLCASTFAFFASRSLGVVGLGLPCPCRGVLGFRNADLCWRRLLVDWPVGKIREVQALAKSRFPFDGVVSGPGLVDREIGLDFKGKRAVNPQQRSGIRRRRRATLAYGRFSSVFPVSDGSVDLVKLGESSGPQDDVDSPSGGYNDDRANHSTCFEKYTNEAGERRSFAGSESDRIGMLERALEEERAASSALYLELEKERAAAATAADEAMAMISRLQNDKASMALEARQDQRLIEEKFAYDEEEIDILKEILVRREKDNHFLEKEIETYRRTSVTGDEQSNDDISDTTMLDDWGQRPPLYSPYLSSEPQPMLHYNNSCHKHLKQSQSDGHELIEKAVILVDHVDHTVMLDSVSEDMNDGRDIVDES